MAEKKLVEKQSSEENYLAAAYRDIEQKFENMFQRLWEGSPSRELFPEFFSGRSGVDVPKMDVVDRDKEIYVKAELPGFNKKDLDVSIANNQLIIKAESSTESKDEDGDYLKQEISRNQIYRSLTLPAEVDDASKVKTGFRNGVLELTIPKRKVSHRKRIEVK